MSVMSRGTTWQLANGLVRWRAVENAFVQEDGHQTSNPRPLQRLRSPIGRGAGHEAVLQDQLFSPGKQVGLVEADFLRAAVKHQLGTGPVDRHEALLAPDEEHLVRIDGCLIGLHAAVPPFGRPKSTSGV
jgi:hypothetical protein